MKANLLILFTFITNISMADLGKISDQMKVIYGSDDRVNSSLYSHDYFTERASNATAALVSTQSIDYFGDSFVLFGESLSEKENVCRDEKFANELAVAECTGVLIAPNILLTASHCIVGNPKKFCKHYKWIFNFTDGERIQDNERLYSCTAILSNVYNGKLGIDFAVVALDSYIEDIEPVPVNFRNTLTKSDQLIMFGHPSGVPQKVTDNGNLRKISRHHAYLEIDSFHGNSGSPIINKLTGKLEGILVSGDEDYTYDSKNRCNRPKVCKKGECTGEVMTRSTSMQELQKYTKTL